MIKTLDIISMGNNLPILPAANCYEMYRTDKILDAACNKGESL